MQEILINCFALTAKFLSASHQMMIIWKTEVTQTFRSSKNVILKALVYLTNYPFREYYSDI